jgi:hypothetical protein
VRRLRVVLLAPPQHHLLAAKRRRVGGRVRQRLKRRRHERKVKRPHARAGAPAKPSTQRRVARNGAQVRARARAHVGRRHKVGVEHDQSATSHQVDRAVAQLVDRKLHVSTTGTTISSVR